MSDVPEQISCPKCNGTMQRGHVGDCGHGSMFLSSWAPGAPRKSFFARWWPIQGKHIIAIKGSAEVVPMAAFRCRDCGFTEFYSHERFKAD